VNLRIALIKEELVEIREKYGDERRSLIEYSGGDVSIEDLIADENVYNFMQDILNVQI
jgi:DNA gyrase subunit A